MIHVSDVSHRYTAKIKDAFKVNDLIQAKIFSDKNGVFHLTTKGRNLGVTSSFCSTCGKILKIENKKLKCENGHTEFRKLSSEYETDKM